MPLSQPAICGDALCIKITEDAYVRGIEACKCNLCEQLVLNKGVKTYTFKKIMAKLQQQWTTVGQWKMLSL